MRNGGVATSIQFVRSVWANNCCTRYLSSQLAASTAAAAVGLNFLSVHLLYTLWSKSTAYTPAMPLCVGLCSHLNTRLYARYTSAAKPCLWSIKIRHKSFLRRFHKATTRLGVGSRTQIDVGLWSRSVDRRYYRQSADHRRLLQWGALHAAAGLLFWPLFCGRLSFVLMQHIKNIINSV